MRTHLSLDEIEIADLFRSARNKYTKKTPRPQILLAELNSEPKLLEIGEKSYRVIEALLPQVKN